MGYSQLEFCLEMIADLLHPHLAYGRWVDLRTPLDTSGCCPIASPPLECLTAMPAAAVPVCTPWPCSSVQPRVQILPVLLLFIQNARKEMSYKCLRCDISLCAAECLPSVAQQPVTRNYHHHCRLWQQVTSATSSKIAVDKHEKLKSIVFISVS